MGLFTAYVAYKAGKRRSRKTLARAIAHEENRLREVCTTCGFQRRFHANDKNESCPI